MSAEKIGPQHLARKALLYVRQSSAHQVLHNSEGVRLRDVLGALDHQHRLRPARRRCGPGGLPSYSPDLSPVEPAWAQVKAGLRRVAARDKDALQRALGPALDRVSAANARAYFRHCGYDRPD